MCGVVERWIQSDRWTLVHKISGKPISIRKCILPSLSHSDTEDFLKGRREGRVCWREFKFFPIVGFLEVLLR